MCAQLRPRGVLAAKLFPMLSAHRDKGKGYKVPFEGPLLTMCLDPWGNLCRPCAILKQREDIKEGEKWVPPIFIPLEDSGPGSQGVGCSMEGPAREAESGLKGYGQRLQMPRARMAH